MYIVQAYMYVLPILLYAHKKSSKYCKLSFFLYIFLNFLIPEIALHAFYHQGKKTPVKIISINTILGNLQIYVLEDVHQHQSLNLCL